MIDGKVVVFFKESKPNGCNFYRIKQPALKMAERGNIISAPSSELKTEEEREMWFEQSDIVVTQITSEPFLEVMQMWKGQKRFVIDWDDNLFNVSPYNPAYVDHGYKDVEVEIDGEKKMLWKDGVNNFHIDENKNRIKIFSKCISMANMVTTPSPILSGMFKQFNQNIRVIKNLIDFSIWNPLPLMKDKTIRIGWQGGSSHYEDWHVVKDAIKRILVDNPHSRLVIMGSCFKGITDALPPAQVEIHDWVGIDAYPHKFKTLNLDIGIAPLENNSFNTAKSELKWTEYSALNIPCVCSAIPPYSLNVHHGDTGYLAATTQEWVDVLQHLIDHDGERAVVGQQARDHVFANYNLDNQITKYEDLYQVLAGMKKELILA